MNTASIQLIVIIFYHFVNLGYYIIAFARWQPYYDIRSAEVLIFTVSQKRHQTLVVHIFAKY